jgi:hypothetical protein
MVRERLRKCREPNGRKEVVHMLLAGGSVEEGFQEDAEGGGHGR